MRDLALILFDVDGTLVNSRAHILMGMEVAFESAGLPLPPSEAILSGVGLSLPVLFRRLLPDAPEAQIGALVEAYKNAFATVRTSGQDAKLSPLFPGIAEMLAACEGHDHWLLGLATGKSRRGLDHLIGIHDWQGRFLTVQCADDHPSKPHPSMVLTALSETGVEARRCIVVGDTSYDMEMGRAAGAQALGVSWGYHAAPALREAGAAEVVADAADIPGVLRKMLGEADG